MRPCGFPWDFPVSLCDLHRIFTQPLFSVSPDLAKELLVKRNNCLFWKLTFYPAIMGKNKLLSHNKEMDYFWSWVTQWWKIVATNGCTWLPYLKVCDSYRGVFSPDCKCKNLSSAKRPQKVSVGVWHCWSFSWEVLGPSLRQLWNVKLKPVKYFYVW